MSSPANLLVLTACIEEIDSLRYTPAGLPALNLKLKHESSVHEAGQLRQVSAVVKAVAFGSMAERLSSQTIGSAWKFSGFLATPRQGKNVVLHIQELQQD